MAERLEFRYTPACLNAREGARRLGIVAGILLGVFTAVPMADQWYETGALSLSLFLWPACGYLAGWGSTRLICAALIWVVAGFLTDSRALMDNN